MKQSYKWNPAWGTDWEAQSKAQMEALRNMRNFHYRDRAILNSWPPAQPPKYPTNAIGIPLIKYTGRFND